MKDGKVTQITQVDPLALACTNCFAPRQTLTAVYDDPCGKPLIVCRECGVLQPDVEDTIGDSLLNLVQRVMETKGDKP